MNLSGKENNLRKIPDLNYKRPVVGPNYGGRHRFKGLFQAVARNLLKDKYEKVFRITSYMMDVLKKAENPDEYTSLSFDDALMYLRIVNAYCGAELGWDLKKCINVSHYYFKHCNVYPCLHSIQALCYLKLGRCENLAIALIYGIKCIYTEQLLGPEEEDNPLVIHEYAQPVGFNSPNYVMMILYACAKVVDLEVEGGVEEYLKTNNNGAEYNYFKRFVDNNTYKCCLGQTAEQLYKMKHVLTLKELGDMSSYTEYLHNLQDDLELKHASNQCTLHTIYINDNNSSQNAVSTKSIAILFDRIKFTEEMMKTEEVRVTLTCYYEGTYKFKSFVDKVHRNHKSHIEYIIGKPYRKPHFQKFEKKKYFYRQVSQYLKAKNWKGFYKEQIMPKLTSIVNDMRLVIIQHFYVESLQVGAAPCKLFPGVESILARMMYLYYECAVPLVVASPNCIWFYSGHILDSLMSCMADLEIHTKMYGYYNKNTIVLGKYRYTLTRMQGILEEATFRINQYNHFIFNSIFRNTTIKWKKLLAETFHYFKTSAISFSKQVYTARCVCSKCLIAFYHASQRCHGIDKLYKMDKLIIGDKKCSSVKNQQSRKLRRNDTGPAKMTKETQTNYSKFSCNNKQTMTSKRLSEEYALKKQLKSVNALIVKKKSLLDCKTALCDDQNKTINSLRKELLTARRMIDEQTKELQILREKVAESSHIKMSTSTETQTDNDYITDNDCLRNINETITSELFAFRQQFFNITSQYEVLQVKCDNCHDCNKELQAALTEKTNDFNSLLNKFKLFEIEQIMKSELDQSVLVGVFTGIFTSLKEFVDIVVGKMNQFKSNCYRIHRDLYSMFHNCVRNLKVKQSFEANLAFLSTLVNQIDCNLTILKSYKAKLCDTMVDLNVVALLNFVDWKTVLLRTEELCSNLFCQYIRNLNIMLVLHIDMSTEISGESKKLLTHQAQLNDNSRQAFELVREGSSVTAPKLGPVGANRPQPSTSYHNLNTQILEIVDPNTKSILSQIADTVKYPRGLFPNYGSLDPQFGAIRRSPVNLRMYQPEAAATPESSSWDQASTAFTNFENDASDFVSPNGKFRDVFIKMQQRFPTTLMGDLIDALEYVRHTHNTNLHKIAMPTISELVFNYITVQTKNRLKVAENCDAKLEVWDTDENCVICFEKLSTFPMYTLKCEHKFHSKCLLPWIRKTNACPICRRFTVPQEESYS